MDHGTSEVVLTVTVDDAAAGSAPAAGTAPTGPARARRDNLFDWVTARQDVYDHLEREVVLFGARQIGS